MSDPKTYQGGCHCGAVEYEFTTNLAQVMDCNCSHCAIKGFVLTFVPPAQFKLLKGDGDVSEYRFNKKVIQHLFCKHCGVESFARGMMPDGSPVVMVNLRCVPQVDVAKLSVQHYDGKSY